MLRDGQSKIIENISNPMAKMPGYDAMQAQQKAFMQAMTGGMGGGWAGKDGAGEGAKDNADDLNEIKKQLADLQSKLSKLG